MDKFLIIDGNNIAFRAFYALPNLQTTEKEKTAVLYGFTNILIKTIQEYKPKYLAVAFDKGKNTFRHKMFDGYKAKRNPTPTDLLEQMPKLKELLQAMNIKVLEEDEIEADDIIGILSKKFDTENYILSADKDILQLISDNTTVISPKKGVTETFIYTPATLKETMGLTPSQIVDLKSLMGDQSDNIPGVAGVGEKTAMMLLTEYQTLDGVYQNIDSLKGKIKEKLETYKDDAYLSHTLATIKTDYNLDFKLEDFTYSFPFSKQVWDLLNHYQFTQVVKRKELFDTNIDETQQQEQASLFTETIIIENRNQFDKMLGEIENEKILALYANQSGIYISPNKDKEYLIKVLPDEIESEKLYMTTFDEWFLTKKELGSVQKANNDKAFKKLYAVGFELKDALNILKPIFNKDKEFIFFNTKKIMHLLNLCDIKLESKFFDISIARYLIYSGMRGECSFANILSENNLNILNHSSNMFIIKKIYEKELINLELTGVYNDIEIPLVEVLFNMELNGFKIDRKELEDLQVKYTERLKYLSNEIFSLAGKEFNINSPKQLSDILFTDLGLKAYNNKKNSTNANILTELQNQHPIIPIILEYRKIQKLLGTYINAFFDLMDKEDKIHTIFHQTLTATGRLSSSEPNLQNIPVKTEESKSIRKVFISRFENGKIVSADYNQIELRLLSIFTHDEKLIGCYNRNEDIHRTTASEIFNIPYDMVTDEMRKHAKAVNFGIVYGISDYGLSQNIGSSRKSAKEYIEQFYSKYPKIKEYMNSQVEFARQNGFVRTYFGRIRNIPEISSTNYTLRTFGERAAMNMPLQGTASDIIKLAMARVFNELKKHNLKSELILQIHDELIIDAHPDEVELVKKILKDEMENIINLSVKLTVDVEAGDCWYNV